MARDEQEKRNWCVWDIFNPTRAKDLFGSDKSGCHLLSYLEKEAGNGPGAGTGRSLRWGKDNRDSMHQGGAKGCRGWKRQAQLGCRKQEIAHVRKGEQRAAGGRRRIRAVQRTVTNYHRRPKPKAGELSSVTAPKPLAGGSAPLRPLNASPRGMGFLQRPSLPTTAPLRGDPDSPGASTLRTQARALGLSVREEPTITPS